MEKFYAYASNEKVMARDDTAKPAPPAVVYKKLITNSLTFSNTKIFPEKCHLGMYSRGIVNLSYLCQIKSLPQITFRFHLKPCSYNK